MKKITLIALAALSLAACKKSADVQAPVQDGGLVTLTVDLSTGSKATGVTAAQDQAVSSVQILVFNAANELEGYASGTSKTLDIAVPAGQKTIWAVCNYDTDLKTVKNIAAFNALSADLTKNAVGKLIMTGSTSKNVTAQDASATVDVRHLVAKVSVKKITRNFTIAAQASKTMTLRGIYLINVPSACYLYNGVALNTWYNKLQHSDAAADALLYDALTGNLAQSASHSTVHIFYPIANASTATGTSATWSPRKTLLVVDTTLDGVDNYYPLWMPKSGTLDRNKHYEVTEITLTKPGSAHPWEPVTSETAGITVNVIDFESGASYIETI